ncbi:prefoldin subunit 2 [[Emmonsia] crescens]|uniref:Prefoldin subunit 2 n=1 Tax=[Emmonsia] crescens TaxID=73230 RepID=A0A0G2HQX5_9EURO|nr:prefoldin subunit 2 [Emmonsia crescens UAMH 3008]
MATQQVNPKRQQELQAQYQNYKNTLQQLAQKIGDIEQETEEHKLVIDTLEPLPGDRKCFRMINGVLVERTVKDVIPSLKTNSDGLKQVLDELLKQYKAKQDELDSWKIREGWRMEMSDADADADADERCKIRRTRR